MDRHDDHPRAGLGIPIVLIAAGVLLFIVNLTVAYAVLLRPSIGGVGFESPGSVVVETDGPGDWTVLHQTAGTFEGQRHEADPRDARGLSISVTRLADGSAVAFEAGEPLDISVGATQRVTVGRFTADGAGAYRVEAAGNAAPVVLYVARWSTSVPPWMVGTLAIVQIAAVALGAVGVVGVNRHRRAAAK